MKNSLTFHHTDTSTVMTGESSIVDSGIIAHPLPDERVLVRIKWGHLIRTKTLSSGSG